MLRQIDLTTRVGSCSKYHSRHLQWSIHMPWVPGSGSDFVHFQIWGKYRKLVLLDLHNAEVIFYQINNACQEPKSCEQRVPYLIFLIFHQLVYQVGPDKTSSARHQNSQVSLSEIKIIYMSAFSVKRLPKQFHNRDPSISLCDPHYKVWDLSCLQQESITKQSAVL